MKVDEVTYGSHEIGNFLVSIQSGISETREAYEVPFFEVLVLERQSPTRHSYVSLAEDPRFAWFKHMALWERKLTSDDLEEYNAHVTSLFHKNRPTHLATRPQFHPPAGEAVPRCHEGRKQGAQVCQSLTSSDHSLS